MKLVITNNKKVPEIEILEFIKKNPNGVAIVEISNKKGFSRNTVSKYVKILESKKKIFSKKIGYYNLYFCTETGRDFEGEILECIRENPRGLTITEIANKRGFSRNTVSKYVSLLELKNLIFRKKIGAYNIYFNREIGIYSKLYYTSYYKALLAGLKENYPNDAEIFKNIGRKSLKYLDFLIQPSSRSKKLKIKGLNRILKLYYDTFGKFFPPLNIIRPRINAYLKKKNDGTRDKIIVKFTNSEFLDNSNDYIYHFYIATGIVEALLEREINKTVKCNIESINISDNQENSFIELSIDVVSS